MKRINKPRMFLLLAVWVLGLAFLSYALKKKFEVAPESPISMVVSMVVIGGGMLGGITFLKWLVRRGKLNWMVDNEDNG